MVYKYSLKGEMRGCFLLNPGDFKGFINSACWRLWWNISSYHERHCPSIFLDGWQEFGDKVFQWEIYGDVSHSWVVGESRQRLYVRPVGEGPSFPMPYFWLEPLTSPSTLQIWDTIRDSATRAHISGGLVIQYWTASFWSHCTPVRIGQLKVGSMFQLCSNLK